ncbi:hypothetical protein [Rhizobium sp. NXC14]|uniref:hypothetical protein n=1 Tax=Rhizobium sp. NXC14 TaxID=1981173 RepID=UPI0012F511DB|nr:hypothetical protein [Rhizobium sp. NXC14]
MAIVIIALPASAQEKIVVGDFDLCQADRSNVDISVNYKNTVDWILALNPRSASSANWGPSDVQNSIDGFTEYNLAAEVITVQWLEESEQNQTPLAGSIASRGEDEYGGGQSGPIFNPRPGPRKRVILDVMATC